MGKLSEEKFVIQPCANGGVIVVLGSNDNIFESQRIQVLDKHKASLIVQSPKMMAILEKILPQLEKYAFEEEANEIKEILKQINKYENRT